MNLDKTLWQIMKEKETNPSRLALKIGWSKQRFYQLLKQKTVNIDTLKTIADALGVTVAYIIELDNKETNK
jgi:DNA-binding Xre family transcriptional regulator